MTTLADHFQHAPPHHAGEEGAPGEAQGEHRQDHVGEMVRGALRPGLETLDGKDAQPQ
ncbi:MAG: hypothetical protein HYY66_04790 [Candidatus Tectomicrobia bacterium]|nr:hypothetical protein [Candidatus Tectomicrobia bacterium]